MTGILFLVPTPIGNLEDITLRALRILGEVDLIACEDTRHTRKLLTHFNIKTHTISYHKFNEVERTELLLEKLNNGQSIALVTDAGTPGISDPGITLLAAAIQQSIEVTALPGPCAFVTALVASGLDTNNFYFVGFAPPKKHARKQLFERLLNIQTTLIFYESPHRISAFVEDAADVFGNCLAVVAREISKQYEEFIRLPLLELKTYFAANQVKGEIVILISVQQKTDPHKIEFSTLSINNHINNLMSQEGMSLKQALKVLSQNLGIPKRQLYKEFHNET